MSEKFRTCNKPRNNFLNDWYQNVLFLNKTSKVPPFSNWWLEPILELRQKRINENYTNISLERHKAVWGRWRPGSKEPCVKWRVIHVGALRNRASSLGNRVTLTYLPFGKSIICRLFHLLNPQLRAHWDRWSFWNSVWHQAYRPDPHSTRTDSHKSSFDLHTNAPFHKIKECLTLLNVKRYTGYRVLYIPMSVQVDVCVWKSSRFRVSLTFSLYLLRQGLSM